MESKRPGRFRASQTFSIEALTHCHKTPSWWCIGVTRRLTPCERTVSKGQQPWLSRLSIPIGESVTGWVGANQRAVTNADPLSDFQNVGDRGRVFRSCISRPIQADSQLVGVLTIYSSQPSAFTARSEAIVAALATDIAWALIPSVGP